MKQAASMAIDAHRQDEFRDLLDRHRKIVFKVASTYSRQPDHHADLAKALDDSVTGSSMRKAQQMLDELAQFERE